MQNRVFLDRQSYSHLTVRRPTTKTDGPRDGAGAAIPPCFGGLDPHHPEAGLRIALQQREGEDMARPAGEEHTVGAVRGSGASFGSLSV